MQSLPVAACLEDFFRHHATDETIALLAEFVRVQPKTVERWREGKQLPSGETAMRLRVFLEAIGYHPHELAKLQAPTQTTTRLIAYGAYEVAAVQDMLGYGSPQAVYRALDGRTMPAKTQAYRLERISRDSEDDLREVKQPWDERLAGLRQSVLALDSVAVERVPDADNTSVPPEPPPVLPTAVAAPSPAKRRRERPKHPREGVTNRDTVNLTAKALTHVIFAFDDLVSGNDAQQLVTLVKERISPKRLQALKRFLDQTLKD